MTIAGSLFRGLRVLALISFGLALPAIAHAGEVTDVLGRKVNVPDHVSRIVLGEGRLSYALALLDRDNPFQRIVGWQNDLRKLDPHTFDTYKKKFPAVADIAVIGETSEVSVSVETILALKPDLVTFSVAGEGPKAHSPIADTLAQAGINQNRRGRCGYGGIYLHGVRIDPVVAGNFQGRSQTRMRPARALTCGGCIYGSFINTRP